MLEWGTGYSTLWYSQFVSKYYSIEHDATWYNTIHSNITQLPNVELTLAAVPVGHKASTYFSHASLAIFRALLSPAAAQQPVHLSCRISFDIFTASVQVRTRALAPISPFPAMYAIKCAWGPSLHSFMRRP